MKRGSGRRGSAGQDARSDRPLGLALLGVLSVLGALASAGVADATDAGAAESTGRLAAGQALFEARCGICHAAGGTGAFMLARRLGAERALLAERTDLTGELVRQVVRHGINGMPVFTRIELTDAELAQVIAYLRRRAAGP